MIEVYASITDTEPSELYDVSGITVSEFLASKTDKYKAGDIQPLSCTINGEIVKPSDWCSEVIGADDHVMFHRMPASDVKKGLGFVLPFWGASAFATNKATKEIFRQFTPDVADSSRTVGEQGNQLTPADAKANIARSGNTIMQGFGRYLRYGDYVAPPRKYYTDSRTQVMEVAISLGTGDYEVEDIKIGDSLLSDLGGFARIYQPGEWGPVNAGLWYTSPNVGGNSLSAGIRLQRTDVVKEALGKDCYTANNYIYLAGGGTLPDTWLVGDTLEISERDDFAIVEHIEDNQKTKIQMMNVQGPVVAGDSIVLKLEQKSPGGTSFPGTITTTVISANTGHIVVPKIDMAPGYCIAIMRRAGEIFRIVSNELIYEYGFDRYLNGVKDTSWTGFGLPGGSRTLDFKIVSSQFEQGWTAPIKATPNPEQEIRALEVDLFLPQGLGLIDEETGDITPLTRTVEIQTRKKNSSSWQTIKQFTMTEATRDQLGFTVTMPYSEKDFDVRLRRVQKENTKTTAMDTIEWTALKTKLSDNIPVIANNMTLLFIEVSSSNKIASSSENRINAIVTRKLPPFSGGAPRPTRSIADAFYHVAKSVGYTDDEIDMAELARLHSVWESRGDTFDYFFSETTVKDAMDTILYAGMSSLTVDYGVLRPVRDEPRTVLEQGYSPENMTNRLRRSFSAVQPDEFDGVEVEYTDGTTFTTETVKCFLPGDNGYRLDKIKLAGVTDRDRAWRIGMRARRSQKYRRWTYEFATELDAMNSSYLSYVSLVDNVPGYGSVSLMRSVDANKVVVDEPLEWQDGKQHVIAYRANDGRIVGPFNCTKGDDYTALVSIPAPLPVNYPDREPIHVYFGTTDRWAFPALITEVTPQGRDTVSVTATNYDVRVYADDNNSAP